MAPGDPTSALNNLPLDKFTPILQLLAAYYLGAASSDTFKKFFGINETFGQGIENNRLLEIIPKVVQRQSPVLDHKILDQDKTSELLKEAQLANKRERDKIVALRRALKIKNRIHNLVGSDNLNNCLRPFYIYFGMLAFWMLVLAGFFDTWHRTYSLVWLNLVSTLVSILLLRKILLKVGDSNKHWGTIKSVLVSIFGIGLIILLPEKVAANLHIGSTLPQFAFRNFISEVSYVDFHVMFSIFIVLCPAIFHFCCLGVLSVQLYFLKIKLTELGVFSDAVKEGQAQIKMENSGFFDTAIPTLSGDDIK